MYKNQHMMKLEEAICGYFYTKETSGEKYREYEAYLKLRIRPLMEKLIDEENIELMETVAEKQWFGQAQLENFLKYAGEKHCISSFVWLLNWKKKRYGFVDKDFSLT